MANKLKPRRRGYYDGGVVNNDPGPVKNTLGQSIMGGAMFAANAASVAKGSGLGNTDKTPVSPVSPTSGTDLPPLYARGGKIKHTSGPRIGKDDGLIPAQRGEYVIRKSAVQKLGTKALSQVNRGKLPARKGR